MHLKVMCLGFCHSFTIKVYVSPSFDNLEIIPLPNSRVFGFVFDHFCYIGLDKNEYNMSKK